MSLTLWSHVRKLTLIRAEIGEKQTHKAIMANYTSLADERDKMTVNKKGKVHNAGEKQ